MNKNKHLLEVNQLLSDNPLCATNGKYYYIVGPGTVKQCIYAPKTVKKDRDGMNHYEHEKVKRVKKMPLLLAA